MSQKAQSGSGSSSNHLGPASLPSGKVLPRRGDGLGVGVGNTCGSTSSVHFSCLCKTTLLRGDGLGVGTLSCASSSSIARIANGLACAMAGTGVFLFCLLGMVDVFFLGAGRK